MRDRNYASNLQAFDYAILTSKLTGKQALSGQWIYLGEFNKGYEFRNVLTGKMIYA